MDIAGEVANIHMRIDAKNVVTTARTVKTTPQKTLFRCVRIYKICKEFTYR